MIWCESSDMGMALDDRQDAYPTVALDDRQDAYPTVADEMKSPVKPRLLRRD